MLLVELLYLATNISERSPHERLERTDAPLPSRLDNRVHRWFALLQPLTQPGREVHIKTRRRLLIQGPRFK